MTTARTLTTTAAPPRASYRSVLAVGEFRVLFAGLFSTGMMGGQGLLPSAFGGLATVLGAGGAVAVAGAGVLAGALLTRWRRPG